MPTMLDLLFALGLYSVPQVALAESWQNATNSYVTEQDRVVARETMAAAAKYCEGGFKGRDDIKVDVDDLRAEVGDRNLFQDIWNDYGGLLTRENSTADIDIMEIAQEELLQTWVIMKALPLLLMILVTVCWPVFCMSSCFTWCPCCCRKEREHLKFCKACVGVVVVICALAIAFCLIITHNSFYQITDSTDNLVCSATKLLNTTLNGDAGEGQDHFIGVVPVLDAFNSLENQLSDGSPLLVEFDDILAETEQIQDALILVTSLLDLFGDMLVQSQNARPRTPGTNETLYHECQMCANLGPSVLEISEAVSTGVGDALFEAREEVSKQLQRGKRLNLQDSIQTVTGPLIQMKDQMSDRLHVAVDPDTDIDGMKTDVENYGYYSLFFVAILAVILIAAACIAIGCFVVRPKTKDDEYTRIPSCCACSVWCCAFPFLIFVFLLSGVMNLVTIPVSGLCVLLEEVDNTMINEIVVGMNQSEDHGDMLNSMVDCCLLGSESCASPNLLDILYQRDLNTSDKVYLRETLLSQIQEPVDAAFDQIDQRSGNRTQLSIGDTEAFKMLRGLIQNMSISATLVPAGAPIADLVHIPEYEAMALEPSLQIAFVTSTQCENFTLVIPDQDPTDIPGIREFVTRLKAIPGTVPDVAYGTKHGCLEQVDCTGVVALHQKQACEAGNNFVELKRQLMEGDAATAGAEEVFRCDVFRYPKNGTECNPVDMVQAPNGSWSGDCLRHHNRGFVFTERVERYCTLAQFDEYIKGFDISLTAAINRLDNVTLSTFETIEARMRNMFDSYVLDPIMEVADGITCSFMPTIVDDVVDGFCYQLYQGWKTVTNSYQLTGMIGVVLLLDMYFLWRLAHDNLKAGQHNNKALTTE